jgi:hypothetical protein
LRGPPLVISICEVIRDETISKHSSHDENHKTAYHIRLLRVSSGCSDSQITEGIKMLEGYCAACTYQRRHNIAGGISYRLDHFDGTSEVKSLEVSDLSRKQHVLTTLPLRIRFGPHGDLLALGKRLRVDLDSGGDDDEMLTQIYEEYLEKDNVQKCDLGSLQPQKKKVHQQQNTLEQALEESNCARLELLSQAKYQEYAQRQEQEYRESNISRGLDILSIANRHREKQLIEEVVETLQAMDLANEQLAQAADATCPSNPNTERLHSSGNDESISSNSVPRQHSEDSDWENFLWQSDDATLVVLASNVNYYVRLL